MWQGPGPGRGDLVGISRYPFVRCEAAALVEAWARDRSQTIPTMPNINQTHSSHEAI
jgi:hypothetical protein